MKRNLFPLLILGLCALRAASAPLAIATKTVPAATGGVPYSQPLAATGGTAPYTWAIQSGGLPPGLALTAAGTIGGTPTTASWAYSYPFTIYVRVTDATSAKAFASIAVPLLAPSGGTPTPPPPPPTSTTPPPPPASPPSPMPVVPAAPTNPILFVTQIPIGNDFTTIGSAFGNHRPGTDAVGRGGDLYIRYPNGTLRNLTAAAGWGVASGFQGATSIAVRDPAVHWNGQKAVFSMVVGAPTSAFGPSGARWQLYEITGLGAADPPVITPVAQQPAAYNNISPCYGTDGRIIFVSDRPRSGQSHHYPQLDEYELAPTTTGLWSLDPASGDLFNLNHTPSGAFTPSIDSFGRVIFVRWDHLQRDQEADLDNAAAAAGQPLPYGTFNYTDETAGAAALAGVRTEIFPEPRAATGNTAGHTFNIFFPWMINEDGTEEETINHVGRHELSGYLARSFTDDSNLVNFNAGASSRLNHATYVHNFHQVREDPARPGRYLGTDAPEFGTHTSGQLLAITAPPHLNPDQIPLTYLTDLATKASGTQPTHTGHYRDPLPLANGTLVAVHTGVTADETRRGIGSDYDFRLKTLWQIGATWRPHQPLTGGISKSVSFYANGALATYSGPLWELNPVEVRARPIPAHAKPPLGAPEQQVFAEEGVSVPAFQSYLRARNLALVVSRDVTTRDHGDRQQPFNLRIAGTATQTLGTGFGRTYDVSFLQFFQADAIRGLGLRNASSTPLPGRRVLAQPLHDSAAVAANPPAPAGPAGSVQLGADGSMAAFLPARRAATWQLTDPSGAPVVRERYWLTFQPGEIRTCASCHGVNQKSQAGLVAPTNKPEALRTLLQYWKAQTGN